MFYLTTDNEFIVRDVGMFVTSPPSLRLGVLLGMGFFCGLGLLVFFFSLSLSFIIFLFVSLLRILFSLSVFRWTGAQPKDVRSDPEVVPLPVQTAEGNRHQQSAPGLVPGNIQ